MRNPLELISQVEWLGVRNIEASETPANAILRIVGMDADGTIQVGQPNAVSMDPALLLVNGPVVLAASGDAARGDYGQAHRSYPCGILYDAGTGMPSASSLPWGTTAGAWKLSADYFGFYSVGGAGSAIANFQASILTGQPVAVKVTSLTMVGSYYPAVTETYNGSAFVDGVACYFLPLNGETPALNHRYGACTAAWIDPSTGKTVYCQSFAGGGGGGSIIVREDDNTPSYSGISDLAFHDPSYVVSQPGTGQALITPGWGASTDIQPVDVTNQAGTSELHARADHKHQTNLRVRAESNTPLYSVIYDIGFHDPSFTVSQPGLNKALITAAFATAGTIQPVGVVNQAGVSDLFARGDHVHATNLTVQSSAGGFVYTIINNVQFYEPSFLFSQPAANQALVTPAFATGSTIATVGPAALAGTSNLFPRADHVHPLNLVPFAANISADQNDYTPATLALWYTLNVTGSRTMTGWTAGANGQWMTVSNTGSGTLKLTDEDGGSAAGNRFKLTSAGTSGELPRVFLYTGQSCTFLYDGAVSRWRMIATDSEFDVAQGLFHASPYNIAGSTDWRAIKWQDVPIMQPSGAGHAPGLTADTPAVAGSALYLREDASWSLPGFVRLTFTANFTITGSGDTQASLTSSGSAITATLPPAANRKGQIVWVTDESGAISTTNTLSVVAGAGDTLDRSVTMSKPYDLRQFQSDGSHGWTLREKPSFGPTSPGLVPAASASPSATKYLDETGAFSIPVGTTLLTTKGDLYTFSTVAARLPVGADGYYLTADSTQTTGLKWAALPAIGFTRQSFSNAAYTVTGTQDVYVAQIGTMSAARVVTLPAVTGRAGQTVVVIDESGTVTGTNKITCNGIDILLPYGFLWFESDGAANWTNVKEPVFGASGANHSSGLVPSPSSSAGATAYLREDGTWAIPPGTNVLTTLGDLLYENATPAPARLPGNTSATLKFLTQTGTGTVSAPPVWNTIAVGDLAAHKLLSATHPDTVPAAPVRGDLVISNATPAWTKLAVGVSNGTTLTSNGTDPSWNLLDSVNFAPQSANIVLAGPTSGGAVKPTFRALVVADIPAHNLLSATHGDTVAHAPVRGDLIVGNSTPAWARVAVGAASTLLTSNGTDPSWGTVNLLSAFHGDTVANSPVLGDVLFGNSTPAWDKLAGNTTSTKKFLRQTGTGTVSAAPAWDTIVNADLPSSNNSTSVSLVCDMTCTAGSLVFKTRTLTFANGACTGIGTCA